MAEPRTHRRRRSPRGASERRAWHRQAAAWCLVLGAGGLLALSGCGRPGGRPPVAYYEHAGALAEVTYRYQPIKVAARKGLVAVLDSGPALGFQNSRVLLFDGKSGALVASVELPRGAGRDARGSALAADEIGRVYVAVEGKGETHLLRLSPRRIQAALATLDAATDGRGGTSLALGGPGPAATPRPPRQTTAGAPAAKPTGRGARPLEEWDRLLGGRSPSGLAVDERERLWLVDGGNHRILRLSWKSNDPAVVGSPRELNRPRGGALHPSGAFYTRVVEGARSLVLRFDPSDRLGASFEVRDVAEPGPWLYNDLAVDRQGRLYLTDHGGARVLVFTAEGERVGALRAPAMTGPMGLAFAEDDLLYVADARAKQVLRFRPVYEKEAAERAAAAKTRAAAQPADGGSPAAGAPATTPPIQGAPGDAAAPERR